jgi:hypothetical protein
VLHPCGWQVGTHLHLSFDLKMMDGIDVEQLILAPSRLDPLGVLTGWVGEERLYRLMMAEWS